MKKEILFCFSIGISMLLLPCICLGAGGGYKPAQEHIIENTSVQNLEASKNGDNKEEKKESSESSKLSENYSSFKIKDADTGEIITVEDREFCYGAVAAEMPPSFEPEALKAQCVAAYTYFCRERKNSRENPQEDLNGADFEAKLSNGQYYISRERLKEKWGNLYESSFEQIKMAVDDVFGEVLTYDDELIVCAYHAISGGVTEACSDIFSADLPYLSAVASPYDKNAPGYQTVEKFSKDKFKEIILASDNTIEFSQNPQEWIKIEDRTDSGTVTKIKVGSGTFSGQNIRSLFSLRSACFDVSYDEKEGFVFTVRGYGHGVGMSQYGAEYMAEQGADYKEILSWYFTGSEIQQLC